ncbi:MAG: hypothetical protein J6S91_10995 [Treponema sp.]|nr:hypothetical protein [Treponema sp.]
MKRRITFLTMAFFIAASAIPVVAGGTKEDMADEQTIVVQNQKNVLHVVGERPADFGEGGGGGAARVPEGFEEENILKTGEVQAELVVKTGRLKVSGGKGKRKFKLKADDGKTYQIQVEEAKMEVLAELKGKNIKVRGVFYGNTFLVFDFILQK